MYNFYFITKLLTLCLDGCGGPLPGILAPFLQAPNPSGVSCSVFYWVLYPCGILTDQYKILKYTWAALIPIKNRINSYLWLIILNLNGTGKIYWTVCIIHLNKYKVTDTFYTELSSLPQMRSIFNIISCTFWFLILTIDFEVAKFCFSSVSTIWILSTLVSLVFVLSTFHQWNLLFRTKKCMSELL